MPTAHVQGDDGTYVNFVADPTHGEDFCDSCGDCLDCYGDDPCRPDEHWPHAWVVYADKAAEFHADHPEAVREGDE